MQITSAQKILFQVGNQSFLAEPSKFPQEAPAWIAKDPRWKGLLQSGKVSVWGEKFPPDVSASLFDPSAFSLDAFNKLTVGQTKELLDSGSLDGNLQEIVDNATKVGAKAAAAARLATLQPQSVP